LGKVCSETKTKKKTKNSKKKLNSPISRGSEKMRLGKNLYFGPWKRTVLRK